MRLYNVYIILWLLSLLPAHAWAESHKVKTPGGRCFVYRYYLSDKQGTPFSIDNPRAFLSKKALQRRQRQNIEVDSTDLPISPAYVGELAVEGTRVVARSRWQNTVSLLSSDSLLLSSLAAKPFVRKAEVVYVAPDSIDGTEDIRWNIRQEFNKWDSVKNDPYGMARPQIEMLRGDSLHEHGFRGKGMTIAILDGGFQNYDRIPAFSNVRIAGTRDFVCLRAGANARRGANASERLNSEATPTLGGVGSYSGLNSEATPTLGGVGSYSGLNSEAIPTLGGVGSYNSKDFHAIDHGTKVFSAMAAYAPEVIIGTAPEATYWLLRSEVSWVEQPVEEDFWTTAAEFADSVGADLINSSLGYHDYDEGLGSYRIQDLDGKTSFVSRTASMLASKGMVLCNSAGNSGMGQWKKIGVPADASDILTVGAIDPGRRIAAFSSVGPSQDGRIKPDVVALGAPAQLISGRGALNTSMGTSFATPIICGLTACLWQALPTLTAREIIDLVRQCSDSYQQPTNVYGYGLPNFWQAYQQSHHSH